MMKQYKSIIILGLIICVLLGSFFFLGNEEPTTEPPVQTQQTAEPEKPRESLPPEETEAPEKTQTPKPTRTPAPEEKKTEPAPKPTQTPVPEEKKEEMVCSLLVRCDSVLANLEKLKEGKAEYLPKDGIVLSVQEIPFTEGESCFDVLERTLREHKIHFEFTKTAAYNSAYIEGIHNLYEFDCGDSSGWLYKVNGVRPNYGSSSYKVQKGDQIEFYYSCNLFE